MNEPYPPSYAPQSPRPQGMGCFAKGCLTVVVVFMLLGVMIGYAGWKFVKSAGAYLTHDRVPVRTLTPTDAEYEAVLAKFQPFNQALTEGREATLALTADDMDILIARDPRFASMRGKVYLSIVNGALVADLSTVFDENQKSDRRFLSARVTLDASYSGGDFAFVFRHVEPLGGEKTPGFVSRAINNGDFLQGLSQSISRNINRDIERKSDKDGTIYATLEHLRTIQISDNQIVAISTQGAPLPTPVATPAKTE